MSRKSEYQTPWFHERLIESLINCGMSVPEVAKKAHISKSHAYRIFYEMRWPSIPVLLRLEHAMGVERGGLVSTKKSSN